MRSSSLLPSRLQPHQQQSRPLALQAPRRAVRALPVRAKLAKPTSVKGISTVGARKQQLAKQLAQQEQQQQKTLAVSRTTRGLGGRTTSSGSSSEQAGSGPSSRRGSRFYFNFTGFPFPLGPFFERKTVRTEVRRCAVRGKTPADVFQRAACLGCTIPALLVKLLLKHPSCHLLPRLRQVVKGQVWTFEQTQAFFFDVFTPVRMTVIKLKSGGLWVHAPIAPTQVSRGRGRRVGSCQEACGSTRQSHQLR